MLQIREDAYQVMKETDPACSLHDFRVVHGKDRINLIFDMVVPREYDEEKKNDVKARFCDTMKQKDGRYEFVITMEHSFVAEEKEEE